MRRSIATHLFLVHNLDSSTQFYTNGPLWSVATECQIYLLFPLLVAIWKRSGLAWMMAFAFVAGHLLFYLTGHLGNLNFLFTFALGVAAAQISFGTVHRWAARVGFVLSLIAMALLRNRMPAAQDVAAGAAGALLMVLCASRAGMARRLLSWPALTRLGGFSYSIYLTHDLVLQVVSHTSLDWLLKVRGVGRLSVTYALLLAVILPLAYLFYLCVERPFVTKHAPRRSQGSAAAVP